MVWKWLERALKAPRRSPDAERLKAQRERSMALGISHAKWLHSGAPCVFQHPASPAELAMDETHRQANGQVFDLARGLKIDGVWTFPGEAHGCKCVHIPELSDLRRGQGPEKTRAN